MTIPIAETNGISARIPHTTQFVVFLDYDNILDGRLVDELQYLQELFRIGDFHVFSTNEFGRHVICLDRMALRESLDVVYASTCDQVFKRGVRINEYRTWILRTHKKGSRSKPRFVYSVNSPYNGEHLQSQAHGLFLQKYYDVKVRLTKPDLNSTINFQRYKTSSKIGVDPN